MSALELFEPRGFAPGPDVHQSFVLPPGREATSPPEHRGVPRDEVALLVARPGRVAHTRFADLGAYLGPGDLVVVNTSATVPAALDATWRDEDVVVHVSTPLGDGGWVIELRRRQGGPVLHAQVGDVVGLAGGATATLLQPDGPPGDGPGPGLVRLWRAHVALERPMYAHLARFGRPITYGYVPEQWPLEAYQTVFARDPGSAEMASAGRPFSHRLVTDLVSRGIGIAPVTLHAGVSSLEAGEAPRPERFAVPAATADHIEHTRRSGGRVVAVGTTVTRAVESAVDRRGHVRPGRGWTDLVLGPDRPAVVVQGLVTGWHEPGASHLQLLEAVAGPDLVSAAYAAALEGAYLWHEFGDSCLLLP